MSAHEAIDRDFDAHLERIRDFLRIPSVSAADGDLRSTADAVCELIAAAGGNAEPREPGRAASDRDRRDHRTRGCKRLLERRVQSRIARRAGVVERGHGDLQRVCQDT